MIDQLKENSFYRFVLFRYQRMERILHQRVSECSIVFVF